jgi:hypothetical protein
MNVTTPKIVMLVVATSVLTSYCTSLVFKRMVLSSAGFMAQPGQAMMGGQGGMTMGRSGMTLMPYPSADPKALADLENKVKERQGINETVNEFTINLKPYVNCKLTDPLADDPEQKDHTMSELPTGVHIYGGVPFDVQGLIQLNSQSVKTGIKLWPLEVKDIAIGHPFKKLHLLNGAFNIVMPSAHVTFAKLILHYADGSTEELGVTAGEQALRCVDGAIPEDLSMLQTSQTELAWVGSNPYLKKNNPSASLHLYRATFDNPKPDIKVTTIDYLSPMMNPGPFMAGLTVE